MPFFHKLQKVRVPKGLVITEVVKYYQYVMNMITDCLQVKIITI